MKIRMSPNNRPFGLTAVMLILILPFISCTSFVVIGPPYQTKLRVGDGVKLTLKDGTLYSGRITYVDQVSIVIRTPKQTKSQSPVEVAQFGTTIPWSEVNRVKVSGTLDSQGKLISNEEIRVNYRSNYRRNMVTNIGLVGVTLSFLGAAIAQDQVSPTNFGGNNESHLKGRIVFWSSFILGSVASLALGYETGSYLDRQVAITRIERFRHQLREATKVAQDSLNQNQSTFPIEHPLSSPSSQ